MKLCWHKWKIWELYGHSITRIFIVALLNILVDISIAILPLLSPILTERGIWRACWALFLVAMLIISIVSITELWYKLESPNSTPFLALHKDKSCLKCGKHVFDATIAKKKYKPTVTINEIDLEKEYIKFKNMVNKS